MMDARIADTRPRAAADDLLDVLRLAVEYIQRTPPEGRWETGARQVVLTRARAVIHQATGETV